MKARLTVLIAVLLSGPAAAQERTADVLADKFLLQATQALERGDREEALQAFREIEALNVEPPAMFAYRYGRVLVEQGAGATDWRKGRSLLTRFAIRVGRGSEHYPSALELLLAANAALEVVESPTRLEERLPDVRRGGGCAARAGGGRIVRHGVHPGAGGGCADDEKPVRQVRIRSFEITRYETTQETWEAVMGENPSAFSGCPKCPVETVCWDDVQAFLKKLNAGGERYRLPSEAQWEYAARGGGQSKGYVYSGSDNWADVAWYYENSANHTHPVGGKEANELGLFDLSGNVREWVQDCWHGSYADAPGG